MTAAADIVNRALELIASQVQVTGSYPTFDGSQAGDAAAVLYQPAVELLLRQMDPAFARSLYALDLQVTPAPTLTNSTQWAHEYAYPALALRVRQIRPAPNAYNGNDPQPIRATVATDPSNSSPAVPFKVILANVANAIAVITTTLAGVGHEDFWDSSFQEAVARRLANPMAMALAGRPDFARELLEEAEKSAAMADLSDEM